MVRVTLDALGGPLDVGSQLGSGPPPHIPLSFLPHSAPLTPPSLLNLQSVVKVTLDALSDPLGALRTDTYEPGPRSYCGEPMFVQRCVGGED